MYSQDIIIVGAGVIGLSTAYTLAKSKIRVSLVDQYLPFRKASWAGAGIIPPGNPIHAKNPVDWLRAKSAQLFPELSSELLQLTGINNGYTICGGLELTQEFDEMSEQGFQQENINFKRVDAPELHSSFPHISKKFEKAIHFQDMAQIRNPRHLKALTKACISLGVKIYNDCKITGLLRKGEKIIGLDSESGVFTADQFIITTGCWSGIFLKQEQIDVNIFPIKGQMLLLQSSLKLKEIILNGKMYIVPRRDDLVLVGSTEEDVGFNPSTSFDARDLLFKTACDIIPDIEKAKIIDQWSGLRPASSNGRPLIGKSPFSENLYFATGHFRQGLQTSPATAMVIKSLLLGEKTEFNPGYFMHTTHQDTKSLFQS